jgi:large subunit ribosomal protein L25
MKKTKADQKKLLLSVTKRTILGKKLKKLRIEGFIPANIFGVDFKSTAVTTSFKDFMHTYKIAKETGVVYIQLDKEEIPVLIQHVQLHPVTDLILHVDLRKIDLKKKIETHVPIQTIGQSEAVAKKGGVLLTHMEKLLVEALPQNIPQTIKIDISVLKDIGNEIKVSDIAVSTNYSIKEEPSKVIISVIAHKEESVTPETTVAAPEVITEKPVEGETVTPAAESGKEEKKAEVSPPEKTTKEEKK